MLGYMYRERAAKMYARASYITAVGVVELPYLVAQTLVFVPISYFMIGELRDQCYLSLHRHLRACHVWQMAGRGNVQRMSLYPS